MLYAGLNERDNAGSDDIDVSLGECRLKLNPDVKLRPNPGVTRFGHIILEETTPGVVMIGVPAIRHRVSHR